MVSIWLALIAICRPFTYTSKWFSGIMHGCALYRQRPFHSIPFRSIRYAMCSTLTTKIYVSVCVRVCVYLWLLNIFCAKRHENLKHSIVIQQTNTIQVCFYASSFYLLKCRCSSIPFFTFPFYMFRWCIYIVLFAF